MKNIIFFHLIVLQILNIYTRINKKAALPAYEFDEGRCPIKKDPNEECFPIQRFYVDKKDAKCKKMMYKGSGGTFNNFATLRNCEDHLTLNHNDKIKGCDMKPAIIGKCEMPSEIKDENKKWTYYNKEETVNGQKILKGQCVEFNYTGCGGNNNRFDSEDECKNACQNNGGLTSEDIQKLGKTIPSVPNVFDCHVTPNVNSENPPVKITADFKLKQCIHSAVADENSKRRGTFDTFHSCVETCFPNEDDKIPACKKQPYQHPKPDNNSKIPIEWRVYYDKTNNKCVRFESYAGPFSIERNNFPSFEVCASYCGAGNHPTQLYAEETCVMEKASEYTEDNTNGNLNVERYRYNISTFECEKFMYGGIGGNSNNFKTKELCENICKKELKHIDYVNKIFKKRESDTDD